MTEKELKLASKFLVIAANEFGGHGCNDVPEKIWSGWTKEERQKFVKEYHEYNGDTNEYNPDFLHLDDYVIMGFLAHKILTELSSNQSKI